MQIRFADDFEQRHAGAIVIDQRSAVFRVRQLAACPLPYARDEHQCGALRPTPAQSRATRRLPAAIHTAKSWYASGQIRVKIILAGKMLCGEWCN